MRDSIIKNYYNYSIFQYFNNYKIYEKNEIKPFLFINITTI